MKFTKEQLLGKKIRYNGEKQWQQIVDACTAVGISVAGWVGCEHKDGNTVANISHNFGTDSSCVLLSSKGWNDDDDTMEEFSNLEELAFPFEEEQEKNQVESWVGKGYPPVGTECEYSAMDSNIWRKCTFVGKVGDFVYVDVPHLGNVQKFQPKHIHLRPIKPKSWQEVLCEECEKKDDIFRYFEYQEATDLFKLECHIESDELVTLAERIIELSSKSNN